MRGFVAPTDHDWYRFLRARPEIDEVNFWKPGGRNFRALSPGEILFFKLKAPHDAIGGFGVYGGSAVLPLWQAWDAFEQGNGCSDVWTLMERLSRLNPSVAVPSTLDRPVGCISLNQPVFFPPDEWVSTPADWRKQIVGGRGYDLGSGEGERLWRACLERAARIAAASRWTTEAIELRVSGTPRLVEPRLGQGSFRLAVVDAYEGACAVTTEHSLPALEAAHIRPFHAGGSHDVSNGLLLRRDVHRLYDLGYVTVRPDLRFAVSPRLRDEFANGRVYYELQDRRIQPPAAAAMRPDSGALEWHQDVVFRTA